MTGDLFPAASRYCTRRSFSTITRLTRKNTGTGENLD
jgi:hypothetical protein